GDRAVAVGPFALVRDDRLAQDERVALAIVYGPQTRRGGVLSDCTRVQSHDTCSITKDSCTAKLRVIAAEGRVGYCEVTEIVNATTNKTALTVPAERAVRKRHRPEVEDRSTQRGLVATEG